jgi:ion channel
VAQTWASIDVEIVEAAVLSLVMLASTTALHYEALRFLGRISNGLRISRRWMCLILAALVTVHLAEVALYAGAYAFGANALSLGGLSGSLGKPALDFFYFAAETYSTLGYGDLVPVGALRLIASVESLNGLLLLSWSGAFLYGVIREPAT